MSARTPGPLALSTDATSRTPWTWIQEGFQAVVLDANGNRIAAGIWCYSVARLASAAPDLLEAAKHAAMEWRLHGQLTDSCRVLEAAIAKAEGRP